MKKAMDRWSMRCTVIALAAWSVISSVAAAQAPPPAAQPLVVSDVVIHGNKRMPPQHVLNYLRTRVGTSYDRNIVAEDIKELYKTHQFYTVEMTVESDKPARGQCIVHVWLSEVPGVVQSIEYNGANHAKKDDLEIATGIKRGSPMNPYMNQRACQAIERYYHDKGRAFAQATLREGAKASDEKVVFDIIEGPVVHVKAIDFVGNTFEPGAVLRTHVQSSRAFLGFLGGQYEESIVIEDKAKLEEYYKSFGYESVRVDVELVPNESHDLVTLVFHVQEGPRFRVVHTELDAKGTASRFVPEVQHLIDTKDGGYYSGSEVKTDIAKMQDWLGYQGYKVAIHEEQIFGTADKAGTMQVKYEIEDTAPQPARVGNIYIIGNDRTREDVIRRQLHVYPGQILSYPDVRISEKNLERLGIFANNPETGEKPTIEVLPQNDPNNPFHDLLVHVQEQPTGSLLFGIGVNSDSGLTGSVVLNERNFDIMNWPTSIDELLGGGAFRGAGQEFRAEAVPGTVAQRYDVSFREPYLFDTPYSFKIDGYYFTRIYNEYSEDRIGGRVTVGRRLGDNWTVSGSVRLEGVNIYNIEAGAPPEISDFYGNHFLAGFSAGVTYDTRDSYLRPTSGMTANATAEEVTGSYTFPKLSFEINKYFTAMQRADGSGRQVVALRSIVAWAGENAPVYERYYAGGFQSLRGFEFRGVGPDINGFKIGGDFMFLNSIEYQVPILANDRLYTLAFIDSGTVEQSVEIKNYRVTAGFGFRISVPMLGPVPIALDFGFPIVQAPFDNKQIFSFSVGWFH
jgi:outer membrane protein assembly complex protein YaeT